MTTAQVVETSVTVTNSSFQNYTHPDNHTRQTTNIHVIFLKFFITNRWFSRGPEYVVSLLCKGMYGFEYLLKEVAMNYKAKVCLLTGI